jgi:hypothetical protein
MVLYDFKLKLVGDSDENSDTLMSSITGSPNGYCTLGSPPKLSESLTKI